MKKIDKLILLDFIPPYLMSFFVAEFVLVMQFLWKYIDEIIGKGISLGVLLELIFYFAVRIIPEAVPVTILIASVMVFGNLAEKYELSSMKSAGISLTRIMLMGVVISFLTALFSLFASNYLKPRANYKFYKRFISVRKQDATLNIEEGIFMDDFNNFTIRVGDKKADGQTIEDVLIYNTSSPDKRQLNMLRAKEGKMYTEEGSENFVMDLEEGEQYRELKDNDKAKTYPFIRTKFKKWHKVFDMSEFNFEAANLNQSRKKYDLLNSFQLLEGIDSLNQAIHSKTEKNLFNYNGILEIAEEKTTTTAEKKEELDNGLPTQVKVAIQKKDKQIKENINKKKRIKQKRKQKEDIDLAGISSILETFIDKEAKTLIKIAKDGSEKRRDKINQVKRDVDALNYTRSRYTLRFHQQYSWAVVCIVFLFIGAPLGSIVKKGGYGYPLLIAIIFFMLFIILNIMGEKLNKSGELTPILAAWLPNVVLIPFAIFISYKALNDADFKAFNKWLSKLFQKQ